jgi:restriction endonuclease Mrr
MATRADKIYDLLISFGGRLRVSEITKLLSGIEKNPDLQPKFISSTVSMDNKVRKIQGRALRFNRYGDGTETFGYVSVRSIVQLANDLPGILNNHEKQIPAVIERANEKVRDQLLAAIQRLSWREFESFFLYNILEVLGFQEIEITRPTRDNGADAYCVYKRGLVKSLAIVSAKHWKNCVGNDEIRRLRGIRSNADTAIIVTSGKFSQEAVIEAEPSQNQRAIVLINAALIVETCFDNIIGVELVEIPQLYKFTKFNFKDHE